ncbi:hypothetical protein HanIR_Chr08g0355391 [Helianthus annuus]|nr:hypothetical protein HanIR_Chr08g0355391 [Helianthus annuus]
MHMAVPLIIIMLCMLTISLNKYYRITSTFSNCYNIVELFHGFSSIRFKCLIHYSIYMLSVLGLVIERSY